MSKVISSTISHNTRALHTLVKLVLKIIIIRSLTCATTGMIESVVALAPTNVQQTKALVLKCCRVRWTHWLLVRRAVVITNTTGIKCRESFADGMVIASNICARVNIFEKKYKITDYDRNLTILLPKLLLEIFLKHEVLKIIHFSEKYYSIRHAGLDVSQRNYKGQYIFLDLHDMCICPKNLSFCFLLLFSTLKLLLLFLHAMEITIKNYLPQLYSPL